MERTYKIGTIAAVIAGGAVWLLLNNTIPLKAQANRAGPVPSAQIFTPAHRSFGEAVRHFFSIRPEPVQPIAYQHKPHIEKAKLQCDFCHVAVAKGPVASIPGVKDCMVCHQAIATDKPEIQKLQKYYAMGQGTPVPWIRIHKLPDYVRFPHMRHVNAGVTCQTCHGPIQEMTQVYQYSSLNMGWCVQCHVNGYDPREGLKATGAADTSTTVTPDAERKRARYDCASCHY